MFSSYPAVRSTSRCPSGEGIHFDGVASRLTCSSSFRCSSVHSKYTNVGSRGWALVPTYQWPQEIGFYGRVLRTADNIL